MSVTERQPRGPMPVLPKIQRASALLRARPRLGDAYPPVLLHFTKVKPWAARGDSAVSGQPGMSEWAAVCDDIGCCDQPGACGPRPDLLPRGPHFRRKGKAAGRRALP